MFNYNCITVYARVCFGGGGAGAQARPAAVVHTTHLPRHLLYLNRVTSRASPCKCYAILNATHVKCVETLL